MNKVQLTLAVLAATGLPAAAQTGTLQQGIMGKFTLTEISRDRSTVVTPGTPLVLAKDGLQMYATVCPSAPQNNYDAKKEKLTQPIGKGFLHDLSGSMRMAGGQTTADCPQRRFTRGTKLWVTRIDLHERGVTFHLYSAPEGDTPYYGDLTFPFEKHSNPAPAQALATIDEVLNVAQDAPATPAAQAPAQPADSGTPQSALPSEPPSSPVTLRLPATYVNPKSQADYIQLNADYTLALAAGGQSYRGTFKASGNTLEITIDSGTTTTATLDGNKLTDANGEAWVLSGQIAMATPGGSVISNQDVIDLVKAGIDDETILTKIAASKCQFNTSTPALIELKKAGVSGAVQKAMVGAPK